MLERIKERLLQKMGEDIESIVVFGSYARGSAHSYSDIDLLVILRNPPRERYKRVEKVLDALGDLAERVNPLVIGKSGLVKSYFFLNVAREGKILFDRGTFRRFKEEVNKIKVVEKEGGGKWGYAILQKIT